MIIKNRLDVDLAIRLTGGDPECPDSAKFDLEPSESEEVDEGFWTCIEIYPIYMLTSRIFHHQYFIKK